MNNQAASRPCYSAVLGYTGNTTKSSPFNSPNTKTNSKLFFITRVSSSSISNSHPMHLSSVRAAFEPPVTSLSPVFLGLLSYSPTIFHILPFNICSLKIVTRRA